jgi:hypothetical protein
VVIVPFDDIDGIVNHQVLFKLSFHNILNEEIYQLVS